MRKAWSDPRHRTRHTPPIFRRGFCLGIRGSLVVLVAGGMPVTGAPRGAACQKSDRLEGTPNAASIASGAGSRVHFVKRHDPTCRRRREAVLRTVTGANKNPRLTPGVCQGSERVPRQPMNPRFARRANARLRRAGPPAPYAAAPSRSPERGNPRYGARRKAYSGRGP